MWTCKFFARNQQKHHLAVESWSFKEAATFGSRSTEEFCATRGILRAPFCRHILSQYATTPNWRVSPDPCYFLTLLVLTPNSQPDPDRLKIVCEFQRLSLREENYPFIYHKAIKEDLHLYEIRWPFRHHELFYYNKKLFIHYFLVPGRQVPFLVREGLGPQAPYSNYAYDQKYQFLKSAAILSCKNTLKLK